MMTVRVVHPETGRTIFPHGEYRAERIDDNDLPSWFDPCRRPDVVLLRAIPSFRPGMPYDLVSYPKSWVSDDKP